MLYAFLDLPSDDPEILAIYQDKLYALGQFIRQRSPELFDEIIRDYSDKHLDGKIKIELNKKRRTKN